MCIHAVSLSVVMREFAAYTTTMVARSSGSFSHNGILEVPNESMRCTMTTFWVTCLLTTVVSLTCTIPIATIGVVKGRSLGYGLLIENAERQFEMMYLNTQAALEEADVWMRYAAVLDPQSHRTLQTTAMRRDVRIDAQNVVGCLVASSRSPLRREGHFLRQYVHPWLTHHSVIVMQHSLDPGVSSARLHAPEDTILSRSRGLKHLPQKTML